MEIEMSLAMQAFLGAIVTVAVELLKQKAGVEGWRLSAWALAGSLILGGIYALLKETGYIGSVIEVLSAASLFYAMFVKLMRPVYEPKA